MQITIIGKNKLQNVIVLKENQDELCYENIIRIPVPRPGCFVDDYPLSSTLFFKEII